MRVRLMAPMNDVDRPEDLDVWQRVRDGRGGSPPRLAVIVPVYGREIELMQVLESAGAEPGVETIVVGAGDCRDALQACARQRVQFLCCGAANRGTQMNAGAAVATADRLLFLHADTRLPTGYADQVVRELARPEVVAGAFRLRIDSPRWAARIIERGVGWRSRLFQLPYGDQAIFCRKSDFQRAGGFRELPIMEDYEFIHRMRRRGRVSILQRSVLTSGRRWHRLGFLRTTLVNQAIVMAYRLGIAPDRLATWYRRGERNG